MSRRRGSLGKVASSLCLGALVALEVGTLRGWSLLAYLGLSSVGVVVAVVSYRSLTCHRPPGAAWTGYGMCNMSELNSAGLADHIVSGHDTRSRTRGVVGGRLVVRAEALVLTLGISSRIAGYSGTVAVRWDEVDEFEFRPGRVGLARRLRIRLTTGQSLECRFMGSAITLRQAIGACWPVTVV